MQKQQNKILKLQNLLSDQQKAPQESTKINITGSKQSKKKLPNKMKKSSMKKTIPKKNLSVKNSERKLVNEISQSNSLVFGNSEVLGKEQTFNHSEIAKTCYLENIKKINSFVNDFE